MGHIKYEIEFVNSKWAELYGRHTGEITGPKLKEPYAEVRKSLGRWIDDWKRAEGLKPGGAVPKFRFLFLQVDGKQLVGLGKRVVWCLHCEQVGPVRVDIDGDSECSYCGAGEFDLWAWTGSYEPGRIYEHYSDEQVKGVDPGGGDGS